MYQHLKSSLKPLKYGIRYGKSLSSAYSLISKHKASDFANYIGQSIGMIFLPLIFLVTTPITKRFSKLVQEKITVAFYAGITIGNALGTLLSNTILKNLPSSFSSALCTIATIFTVAVFNLGIAYLVSKIRKKILKIDDDETTESSTATDYRYRFLLGLELGFAIGSSLGACCEFILPGSGLIGTAIFSLVGMLVGTTLASYGSKFLNKGPFLRIKEGEDYSYHQHITKSIKLGALLFGAVGTGICTLFIPAIGPIFGGIIFAGIGGLMAGSCAFFARQRTQQQSNNIAAFFDKKNTSAISFGVKAGICTCSLAGALVGTFIFPGIGTIAGASVGALVGSLVGGVPAMMVSPRKNLKINNHDYPEIGTLEKDTATSLFKKTKLGFSMGSTIGSFVGATVGSFVPGIGTVLGGLAGGFIGGALGITVAAIAHKIERNKSFFNSCTLNSKYLIEESVNESGYSYDYFFEKIASPSTRTNTVAKEMDVVSQRFPLIESTTSSNHENRQQAKNSAYQAHIASPKYGF